MQDTANDVTNSRFLEPLFADEKEYAAFCERHSRAAVELQPLTEYSGRAYLGIDCGSTTVKLVLIGEDAQLFVPVLRLQPRQHGGFGKGAAHCAASAVCGIG